MNPRMMIGLALLALVLAGGPREIRCLRAEEPTAKSKDGATPLAEEDFQKLLKRYYEAEQKARFEGPIKGVPPEEFKLLVAELRRRYPYESLADRLAYEKDRLPVEKTPKLSEAAAKSFDEMERVLRGGKFQQSRVESLQLLHSDEVARFVSRPGFGYRRMPFGWSQPSLRQLDLPPAPAIPFVTLQDLGPNAVGTKLALAKSSADPAAHGSPVPALDALGKFHARGLQSFLNPSDFGHVKDRDHVAGFRSHHFRSMPPVADPAASKPMKDKEPWQLRRVELVSLLKHDRPVAYVSEHLPRMEDLEKAKSRPLDSFEEKALKSLQEGEDLVTEATTNTIRMMGTLRAAKQCLGCHDGQRGQLLGAFTYQLQRDPPLPVAR